MISKKVEEVKKDLYNINLPYFSFKDPLEDLNNKYAPFGNGNQVRILTPVFTYLFDDFRGDNDSRSIDLWYFSSSKIYPFFYSTGLYNLTRKYNLQLTSYFNTLRNKFREP